MKSNKLWVLPTTAEALEIVSERPHSYGNADHCLFIGPEGPEGSREVDEELAGYLTEADWRWIYAESDKIRAEQEAIYRKKAEEARDAFLKRFDAELEKEMAGDKTHEPEENSAGSAETE
jgi:hypothetical protein